MSKRQVVYNVPLAACAAIVLGGLAVPASAQNPIPPRTVPEKHFTVAPHTINTVVLVWSKYSAHREGRV